MVKEIRILIYILILLNAGHAFAYFQANRQSGNLRVDHTTNHAATQGNNTYLIHDHLFFNDPNTILVNQRDDFIYFDKIELDIPLRLLKKNRVTEDSSVDRLLASNLRIRNLLTQYHSLNGKQEALYKKVQDAMNQPVSQESAKSLQQSAGRIEQERQKIETFLKNVSQYDNSPAILGLNKNVIVLDSFEDMAGQKEGDRLYDNYSAKGVEKIENDMLPPSGFEAGTGSKQVLNRGNDQLPWVFNVALKIINYMMNNRIEIIVYTMFVILAGFLVSLKAQK